MSVRCHAVSSRTGEPCKRWAIEGGTVCPTHGGSVALVKQHAAARVLQTKLADQVSRMPIEPVTNPVAVVQDLAGESLAWLAVCREQLANLANLDYTDRRGVRDVKPTIALYERAMTNALRITSDMVRLNIEARMAGQVDMQAKEIIQFVREAVAIAHAEPGLSADAIMLRLIEQQQS